MHQWQIPIQSFGGLQHPAFKCCTLCIKHINAKHKEIIYIFWLRSVLSLCEISILGLAGNVHVSKNDFTQLIE